jgi:hypothetical protein
LPAFIAVCALRTDALDATSLRRTLIQRIGLSTSMRFTSQRIAGFHKMASNTERAADGVITS